MHAPDYGEEEWMEERTHTLRKSLRKFTLAVREGVSLPEDRSFEEVYSSAAVQRNDKWKLRHTTAFQGQLCGQSHQQSHQGWCLIATKIHVTRICSASSEVGNNSVNKGELTQLYYTKDREKLMMSLQKTSLATAPNMGAETPELEKKAVGAGGSLA